MPKRAGKKNRNYIINSKKNKNVNQLPVATKEEADEAEQDEVPAEVSDGPEHQHQQRDSDVAEGKTIFIRNLSYNTEEEDITDLVSQFGDIHYCLICRDKDTGQSRGTAFVKFMEAASAEACMAADQSQLVLDGRSLNIDFALEKTQLQKQATEKSRKETDKRNLYLMHEGWIRAGTPAAEGVSTTDLQKRLALDQKKRNLLKLLTNFVSRTRLCIHNLPPEVDDKKLKELFQGAAPKEAKLTEWRVMRNRLANGKFAGSKGFAFVQFSEHDHALQALRKLNNNPTVFSNAKRPIVEFAIEDMAALNKLKRRAGKIAQGRDVSGSKVDDVSAEVRHIAKKSVIQKKSARAGKRKGRVSKKRKPVK